MRAVLVSLNIVFLIFFVRLTINNKLLGLLIFLLLGFANIRYVDPGTIFYEAYHMLIWYGVLLMFIALMFFNSKDKFLKKLSAVFLGAVFLIALLSPQNILWERVDTIQEINDGYTNYTINGLVIKNLANEGSTLFLDGGDDLIYFVADLKPSYKYSWYTSLMPYYQPFVDARFEMFQDYPPDFYYGNCREGYFLPEFIEEEYINLKNEGRKSCLYIKKDSLNTISESSWDSARELGFGID